jgi:hypothetical protein
MMSGMLGASTWLLVVFGKCPAMVTSNSPGRIRISTGE